MSVYLNCDCMDKDKGMPSYPDKYFDLAIVDPPYGIGFDRENLSMSCGLRKDGTKRKYNDWSNPVEKRYSQKEWDVIPSDDYFNELFRVSKNQIIWGGNYFKLPLTGGWIIWDKQVTMTSLSKGEMAWNSIENHLEIFHYLWAGYRKENPESRIHPTQKPIALYKWLIKNYAKEGYKILDTHVGSDSSLIAFELFGLDYVGFELDLDYYKASRERIDNFRRVQENKLVLDNPWMDTVKKKIGLFE